MEQENKEQRGGIVNYFQGATIHNMVINGNMYNGEQKKEQKAIQVNKAAIMEYVDRLKPMVKREFVETYDQIWDGILELREVKLQVYNKGKQQDTTFNRNLVAQIIHQISELVYMPTANTVKMAECLEPGKGISHPVRQKLGESPEKAIKKSVEEYIETYQ